MTTENIDAGVESQNPASETVNEEQQVEERQEAAEKPQESEQAAEKPAEKGEQPPKMVDIRALHEERNQRRELQRKLAEQQAMLEKVDKRLEVLFNPPKQAPAREQDPIGYIDHRFDELTQQQRQILERQQQNEQQAQQTQVFQHLAGRVQAAEAMFRREHPDYTEAVETLRRARAAELQVFGAPPEVIEEQIGREMMQAALQWAHQGLNPAQVAYGLAKARGYTPKTQQQAQQPSAEEKIAAQQRGTNAARSLGSGGGVSKGKLTAQAIAAMSDEEFAKLSESDWRAAMGE